MPSITEWRPENKWEWYFLMQHYGAPTRLLDWSDGALVLVALYFALAVAVIKIVDTLPDTVAGKHVGGQLLRCGTSPGANYEEARGAESRRDFLHKLGITLKELQETRYWLLVVSGAGLVPGTALKVALPEVDELCKIIGTSKRTATANRKAGDGLPSPSPR